MKLAGLRVVDLSMYLPGPVITQMMADHGAEVIRVEPPGGEPARAFGPFDSDGISLWFKGLHRGKRSVVLDLKSPEGAASIAALAAEADVFIEGYRPGVAARLGVDAATLRKRHPRLVHCSLSAYGQSGPLGTRGSHDMGAQAYTGFLALNNVADGPPAVPGMPSADMASALTALAAILMALYRRESSGRGDAIDIAMYDSLLAWTPHLAGSVLAERIAPTTNTHRSIGGSAFYNIYETRDGRFIALTGREMHHVRAFLNAVGRAELVDAAAHDPGAEQQQLIRELRGLFLTRDFKDWSDLLSGLDVSWAPVLDMVEAFDHPHARARGMLIDDGRGGRVLGTPLKFSEEPGSVGFRAPQLDEDGPVLRGAAISP